jgi:hypothetical protein
MEMHKVLIKNFSEYLTGKEVEATIKLQENEVLSPGEKVLVMKDSIAAATNIPVPRDKQDLSIGVEGTITEIKMREAVKGSPRIQTIMIRKD